MTDRTAPTAIVRRLLPAPPGVVYDEWLDPGALADWMCPRPARCLAVECEPRVGGRLRIDIADGGTEFHVSGRYLVLDRPARLAFTWSCSTWPDPSVESVVNVLLEQHGPGQTMMTIEHSLLPPDLAGRHADGWTAIAAQLAAELTATLGSTAHGHPATGP
jgi:uncharacterized protein YndB with AHSA1/START domain